MIEVDIDIVVVQLMCLLDDHRIEMTTMVCGPSVCTCGNNPEDAGLLAVVGEVVLIPLLGQDIRLRVLLP